MDPNANLAEQLRLARGIQACADDGAPIDVDDATRLAELVLALDEWLRNGGFRPAAWGVTRGK